MELSHSVGRLDWENAVDEIPLEQFVDWMALDALNGVGESRSDRRMTHQTSWLLAGDGVDVQPHEISYDYHSLKEEEEAPEVIDTVSALSMGFGIAPPQRFDGRT